MKLFDIWIPQTATCQKLEAKLYAFAKHEIAYWVKGKIEKVPRDIRRAYSGKITTSSEKDWSQQVEHMQVPKRRDQVSGGVSVPCRHATPVANVLWKPLKIQ